MDILKDFKCFLLGDGLKIDIYNFRNPSSDERFYLDAEYLPDTDSRKYADDDQLEAYPIGISIVPFTERLKKIFNKYFDELRERCENLKVVSVDNIEFVKEAFDNSDVDFNEIRKHIKSTSEFDTYQEQLILFTSEVEALYKGYKFEMISASVKISLKEKLPTQCICFDFKKSIYKEEILKDIYDLQISNKSFINQSKTEFEVFEKILLSKNVVTEEGEIYIGCKMIDAVSAIDKMSDFFFNFTASEIGNSGKFFTNSKKPTVLTPNNLRKTKHTGADVKSEKYLDTFFSKLKEKR
jgi:hypothetical protein